MGSTLSDLVAWQLANELKVKSELFDRSTARDARKFCEQIKDSAASAPRILPKEFSSYRTGVARYTRIAKAFCRNIQPLG
jgi:hypothetical protein